MTICLQIFEINFESSDYIGSRSLAVQDHVLILMCTRAIADVAISKRPLLFTVRTQLRLRSHQTFYEIFTRKQFLPTSAGNTLAQLHFCG